MRVLPFIPIAFVLATCAHDALNRLVPDLARDATPPIHPGAPRLATSRVSSAWCLAQCE